MRWLAEFGCRRRVGDNGENKSSHTYIHLPFICSSADIPFFSFVIAYLQTCVIQETNLTIRNKQSMAIYHCSCGWVVMESRRKVCLCVIFLKYISKEFLQIFTNLFYSLSDYQCLSFFEYVFQQEVYNK